MMWTYNYTQPITEDELMHYGVLGMKWGRRKGSSPSSSAKQAYKAKKKAINDKYNKASSKWEKETNGGKIKNKKADDDLDNAADAWSVERKKAKTDYKNAKVLKTKNAVKKYSKKFEEVSNTNDKVDAQWREVDKLYKATGKTPISRLINNIKKDSEAVKKYQKEYDKVSKNNDKIDQQWREVNKLRMQTGKNSASRFINSVKYSSDKN